MDKTEINTFFPVQIGKYPISCLKMGNIYSPEHKKWVRSGYVLDFKCRHTSQFHFEQKSSPGNLPV